MGGGGRGEVDKEKVAEFRHNSGNQICSKYFTLNFLSAASVVHLHPKINSLKPFEHRNPPKRDEQMSRSHQQSMCETVYTDICGSCSHTDIKS